MFQTEIQKTKAFIENMGSRINECEDRVSDLEDRAVAVVNS